MTEARCSECGTPVPEGAGWVRSGHLICNTCDFGHRSSANGRGRERATHTPRPREYYKAQYHVDNAQVNAWRDIQRVCRTAAEALALARAEAPRAATCVRAMHVTDRGRTPLPSEVR